ncbi:hypothetical protein FB645_005470 [Coemansia sp. IMI 203386]|nr:hypothetical protein FB645_005470 [Coemansia sp. IMI 203386]
MAGGIGPQIPADIAAKLGIKTGDGSREASEEAKDARAASGSEDECIGPAMPPPGVLNPRAEPEAHVSDSDSDSDAIGPSVDLAGYSDADAHLQTLTSINRRLDQSPKSTDLNSSQRESWMLVPPTAKASKPGAAPLFDESWTETPAEKRQRREKEARKRGKNKEEKEEETLAGRKRRKEDEEKAKWVHDYNREQRPKSLLEMHVEKKSGRKRGRDKKGEKDDKWKKQRFDRDRDLAVGRTDSRRRRELLDSVGSLADKYGHSKDGSFM